VAGGAGRAQASTSSTGTERVGEADEQHQADELGQRPQRVERRPREGPGRQRRSPPTSVRDQVVIVEVGAVPRRGGAGSWPLTIRAPREHA